MERYDEIGISNNFMFGRVMSDPELCRRFLEQILNIRIHHIDLLEHEKEIDLKYKSRGIRLDIYAEDGKTVYNCEMQVRPQRSLPLRSRYYQSLIDISLLDKGAGFEDLKKSFVVFICLFDPFGMNRYVYTFENVCLEAPELHLHDEAIKVFINTKGSVGNVSEEFKELMHFLDTSEMKEYGNELVNDLAEVLEKERTSENWGHDYMTMKDYIMDERYEAREEGIALGIKQGIEQGIGQGDIKRLTKDIANIMAALNITKEKAMDILKVPEEKRAAVSADI